MEGIYRDKIFPDNSQSDSNDQSLSAENLRTLIEFNEAVLKNMSEGLYTVDAQGRIITMNPAAERLFGVRLEDVKNRLFHDLVHYLRPDGSPYPADECENLKLLADGKSITNRQDVFVRADGTMFDVVFSASPINIRNEVRGLVVVFRDVTQENRIGAEMRASEARIRIAVEAARQVTWDWDLVEDVIYWNDQQGSVFGNTLLTNPASSNDFFEVLHIHDLDAVSNAIDRAVIEKGIIDLDFRTERPEGGYRWMSAYGQITEWSNGTPARLSGVASDVTDRKKAEESLKESERKLREKVAEQNITEEALRQKIALIELSHDPIFVWDMERGILDWNNGAETLYGYSRNEALGQSSHELLRTVYPNGLKKFIKTLKESGFCSTEVRHFTRDGRELIIESSQQIIESNGRRLVLESNRDVSDRKRSNEILERYKLLSERSQDVIWFLDSEFRFVEVNQAAIDLYGYSRDEFLTMRLTDIRDPSTIGDFTHQFDLAGRVGVHFETLHVRKDGTVFPVDVNANSADFDGKLLVFAIVRDISDRKRAESELRQSEERRKLAQEAGRIGVWDWDAITGNTYWSETMWSFYDEKRSGINPDTDYWSDHLHASDRERVKLHIKEVLDSDKSHFQDEFRIIKKDGNIRWIESIAKVVRDTDGSATRMYGVNLDITDRKDTEERIRLSENQLRLVTNAVPALISYVDSNERYRFVNQQFNEWFGIEAGELVGKKVREVFGNQAYQKIKPKIDEALAGNPVKFETALDYAAAGKRHVHVSYMPDIGVDGTVYGYYGLTNDLTELKRSEELLRSTEERMALMVESVTEYAILSIDSLGRIDSWNSGAEMIFNYTADEAVGKPYDVLFTPEDIARGIPFKEMRTARRKGRASDDRWQLRKDGTRFYASGVMMPLFVGKELTGFAKIATDLTEKQRRADELQKAHDELEFRVRERTRELAQANLALVHEMEVRRVAEHQRIDLLGRLVASQEVERRRIARDLHDHLGQRLTALRLKIASLKEISAGHSEIESRVERLQEIGERLDAEVSFLAWELRPTALDDLGLVEAVGAFVNEWSRHYEIEADFHSSGLSNARLGDDAETHLYRITQEALNNIAKHSRATVVTVLLERRRENVILIIEDDGSGFDPAKTQVAGDSGKGLGLIGMQERATLAGGALEIESAPGKGTTIYVRTPFPSMPTA